MKLLLDTHIFIWWATAPERLSASALAALEDGNNDLLLSVASVWEMQIKAQLGKLNLGGPLKDLLDSQQITNSVQPLSVELTHVLGLEGLPFYHKDPFDRLLIAQTIVEGATLVSMDLQFSSYPVQLLS
jgi:PIN domain nuclease of toxin-antitoxin system